MKLHLHILIRISSVAKKKRWMVAVINRHDLRVDEVLEFNTYERKYLTAGDIHPDLVSRKLVAVAYKEDLKVYFTSDELYALFGNKSIEDIFMGLVGNEGKNVDGLDIIPELTSVPGEKMEDDVPYSAKEELPKKKSKAKPDPTQAAKVTKPAPTQAAKVTKETGLLPGGVDRATEVANSKAINKRGAIAKAIIASGGKLNKGTIIRACLDKGYDFERTVAELESILGKTTTRGNFTVEKSNWKNGF